MAREYGNQMVATVGFVNAFPGAVSVIPERAKMVLEIRNLSAGRLTQFVEEAKEMADGLPDVTVSFERLVQKAPVSCDERIVGIMEEICREKEFSCMRLPSGATHDGNAMAMKMPIAMIFVPSKGGISHSRQEFTAWEDIERGMTLLTETIGQINRRRGE